MEHAKGDLQAGSDADLCVWDEDGEVRGVWKGGREVWRTF